MSELNQKLLSQTLKTAGYSYTLPRKFVFGLFSSQPPQSMVQLTRRSAGTIDRASLYRTVKLFEELGIIHRVHVGWKHKLELSEHFLSHHHHIYCERCGKIIDVKEPPQLKNYIDIIGQKTGFRITSHSFELEGVCADCQKSNK